MLNTTTDNTTSPVSSRQDDVIDSVVSGQAWQPQESCGHGTHGKTTAKPKKRRQKRKKRHIRKKYRNSRKNKRLFRSRRQRKCQAMLESVGIDKGAVILCRRGSYRRYGLKDGRMTVQEQAVNILIRKNSDGEYDAHWSGLAHCDSIWSCWVCAPKRSAQMIEETRVICESLINQGYCYFFLTFTAQHKADTDLAEFITSFSEAYRYMSSTRAFKNIMKSIGYVGNIMSAEVTDDNPYIPYHEKTGWHYHRHYVYVIKRPHFTKDEIDLLKVKILKEWKHSLKKYGLKCNEHGVDVSDNTYETINDQKVSVGKISSYLAKAAAFELIGAALNTKDGRENRRINPWQLNIIACDDDNYIAKMRYKEYYLAMKGRTFLRISKEIRALTKDDLAKKEKEKAEESKDNEAIRVVSFYSVNRNNVVAAANDVAHFKGSIKGLAALSKQGNLDVLLNVAEEIWARGQAVGLDESEIIKEIHHEVRKIFDLAVSGVDVGELYTYEYEEYDDKLPNKHNIC